MYRRHGLVCIRRDMFGVIEMRASLTRPQATVSASIRSWVIFIVSALQRQRLCTFCACCCLLSALIASLPNRAQAGSSRSGDASCLPLFTQEQARSEDGSGVSRHQQQTSQLHQLTATHTFCLASELKHCATSARLIRASVILPKISTLQLGTSHCGAVHRHSLMSGWHSRAEASMERWGGILEAGLASNYTDRRCL